MSFSNLVAEQEDSLGVLSSIVDKALQHNADDAFNDLELFGRLGFLEHVVSGKSAGVGNIVSSVPDDRRSVGRAQNIETTSIVISCNTNKAIILAKQFSKSKKEEKQNTY